jgi:hypothetical protein
LRSPRHLTRSKRPRRHSATNANLDKSGFLWLLINTKPPLLEVRKLMMKQWI